MCILQALHRSWMIIKDTHIFVRPVGLRILIYYRCKIIHKQGYSLLTMNMTMQNLHWRFWVSLRITFCHNAFLTGLGNYPKCCKESYLNFRAWKSIVHNIIHMTNVLWAFLRSAKRINYVWVKKWLWVDI